MKSLRLARPDCDWHLEFTRYATMPALGRPSPEHLLVLYLPDRLEWAVTGASQPGSPCSRL